MARIRAAATQAEISAGHAVNSTDKGILSKISGEYIGAGAQSLPNAETARPNETREVVVNIPFLSNVIIRYRRFTYRHGKSRYYCWVAQSAVKVD